MFELSFVFPELNGLTTHSMRASAATIAIDRGAELSRGKDWLCHENISTTMLYDHRDARMEDSLLIGRSADGFKETRQRILIVV